jgi:hypothetical protein
MAGMYDFCVGLERMDLCTLSKTRRGSADQILRADNLADDPATIHVVHISVRQLAGDQWRVCMTLLWIGPYL